MLSTDLSTSMRNEALLHYKRLIHERKPWQQPDKAKKMAFEICWVLAVAQAAKSHAAHITDAGDINALAYLTARLQCANLEVVDALADNAPGAEEPL